MNKIVKYVIVDIIRNKIVIGYTLCLLAFSLGIFAMEDNSAKGILSLLNIILIVVPLVCSVFSTIYVYNSSEFIELLVSRPLKRSVIWYSLFAGLAIALCLAFIVGIAIPILIFGGSVVTIFMIASGLLLSLIFIAIAMCVAVFVRDKAKGIGVAIFQWLYFAVLFDGIVLLLLFQFADYPLEKMIAVITFLNPVDIARILILLKLDVSALMGYSGAVFKSFFGTIAGISIAFGILLAWVIIPLWISARRFSKKDL